VFWVDSGAARSGRGTFDMPDLTIAAAIARCTASKGDIVMVKAGHAETLTASLTLSKAGVAIVGLGMARNRPALTGTFGAAGDTISVTAANCALYNIRIVSSGATQNAHVAAADFSMSKCVIEQGANNLKGVTVPSGGDRFEFEDCLWLGTANGPDNAIEFESSASDNFVIRRCTFNFGVNGIDEGVIRANADTVEGGIIEDCTFLGVDTLAIDFNSSAGATGDGMVIRAMVAASAALTSVEDVFDVGGYNFYECRVTDSTTGRGAPVPLATAS
jgi:hypothetical protein